MTSVIDRNFNKEIKMRGSLKKLALAFSMLALLAVSAGAQCSGKTVYIQLPSDWPQDRVYVKSDNVTTITGTRQGNWLVFTFPNSSDFNNAGKNFNFTMQNNDNGTNRRINSTYYDAVNNSSSFSCNITSNTVYIMENPSNPGRTLMSTTPPNAYYFYFLPPDDPNWTLGTPYFVYMQGDDMRQIPLEVDPSRCGWYRYMWFNEPVPNYDGWIWLNRTGDDQYGERGGFEEKEDWQYGMPIPFNLSERFSAVGSNPGDLFFVPVGVGENAMWSKNDPHLDGVCSYNFAAIIYDTDWTVNSSFQCGRYEASYSGNQNSECYSLSPNSSGTTPEGYGINKQIPQNTLAPDGNGVSKMQWNQSSQQKDGWTQQNFIDAFKSTPGKNAVRCYDMPFKRNSAGLWEFNSDKLCRNNTMDLNGNCAGGSGYMGGFFPPMLDPNGAGFDNAAYADCPTCRNVRFAESWTPLKTTGTDYVSQYCYDRGRFGTATAGGVNACGAAFGQSDFRNGDNPAIWDWDGRPNFGGTTSKSTDKNQLFCFESQAADFVYEPGQEFFFSGDDDIWVFINNRLAIDLGGTHLAAPGYVDLAARASELGLVAGEKYPINIFFCDRRTTMSNVRITTNMYFAQTNSLTLKDQSGLAGNGAQICVESTGSSGGCAAAGSGNQSSLKCGSEMGNILDYYLTNRRGEIILLNESNNSCNRSGSTLTCYGGITLTNYPAVDRVQVRIQNIAGGLQGKYVVSARVNDASKETYSSARPIEITSFTVGSSLKVVWGQINADDVTPSRAYHNLGPKEKRVVSGKLVPIGFASGNWSCDNEASYGSSGCPFEIFMESVANGGSFGERVKFEVLKDPGAAFSGLTFYSDSLGQNEITDQNQTFIVPSDGDFAGLLVLWVKGDYDATEDESYTISLPSNNNVLKVDVILPRLRFVNPDALPTVTPLAQTKGSDPSLGVGVRDMKVLVGDRLPRAVAAYDYSGSQPVLCETCDFRLTMNAWAEDYPGRNRLDNNPRYGRDGNLISLPATDIAKGIANFDVRGLKKVEADTFAFFSVRGPSTNPETIVQWDSLLFDLPDVPSPISAEIFDRNGDGIGDSVRVAYFRRFHNDSLPSKLLVTWDPGTTFEFGLGTPITTSTGEEYTDQGITSAANRTYWNSDHPNFNIRLEGGQGQNSNYRDSVIVIYSNVDTLGFSEDIKTSIGPTPDLVEVISWATYTNSKTNVKVNTPFSMSINDSIPAIVIKAAYRGQETSCGTRDNRCEEQITITVSEPVKLNPGLTNENAKKAPFAYLLRDRSRMYYDAYYEDTKDQPIRMLWDKSGANLSENNNDSLVRFTYRGYKDAGVGDSSFTPVAMDSVRFVWDSPDDTRGGRNLNFYALTDMNGNKPNPREKGRQIEGSRRTDAGKVAIADLDPSKDILKDALEALQKGEGEDGDFGLFRTVNTDTLFSPNKPVTFLPIPAEWNLDPNKVRTYYPGSIGQLLRSDIDGKVSDIEKNSGPISSDNIVFHAKAYYHTNLGNFVVESNPISVRCSDPIFQINGQGDCRNGGAEGIYFAWNLKDAKARWVGAGAYVEVYEIYWDVTDNNGKTWDFDNEQKIEMVGVRRVKNKR